MVIGVYVEKILMNKQEYEAEFASVVAALKSAREAYNIAPAASRKLRLAELTVLKDKLLRLGSVEKKFPKDAYYKAPLPADEDARLKALARLNVLDSPYEALFDAITQVASQVCGTPIALISLIDADRQWFKANVGMPGVTETPRELAFCGHAILSDNVLEVPDATLDIRFAENPLVTGSPEIRFYAGAPISLPMGEKIGTLCVIDHVASNLQEHQKTTLAGLANVVAKALVARNMTLNNAHNHS